jgi:hypothetical protein
MAYKQPMEIYRILKNVLSDLLWAACHIDKALEIEAGIL